LSALIIAILLCIVLKFQLDVVDASNSCKAVIKCNASSQILKSLLNLHFQSHSLDEAANCITKAIDCPTGTTKHNQGLKDKVSSIFQFKVNIFLQSIATFQPTQLINELVTEGSQLESLDLECVEKIKYSMW
jgi:hypothetical protein